MGHEDVFFFTSSFEESLVYRSIVCRLLGPFVNMYVIKAI